MLLIVLAATADSIVQIYGCCRIGRIVNDIGFGNRHLEMNLRMYISVLINETAFIDGKKHVTFRYYNFMSSSD